MAVHSISRILLATDFSTTSADATKQAISLAMALGAELGVVHVFDPGAWRTPTAHYFAPGASSAVLQQLEEVRLMGQEALSRAIEELPEELAIEPVFLEGRAGPQIVEAAGDWQADLVVVGSHGYSGVVRTFLGSVAEFVVRHAPCAVLTVKASVGDVVTDDDEGGSLSELAS